MLSVVLDIICIAKDFGSSAASKGVHIHPVNYFSITRMWLDCLVNHTTRSNELTPDSHSHANNPTKTYSANREANLYLVSLYRKLHFVLSAEILAWNMASTCTVQYDHVCHIVFICGFSSILDVAMYGP